MLSKPNQYTVVGHSGKMNECMVFVHVDSAISPADAERQVIEFMQEDLDCLVFAGRLPSLTDPAAKIMLLSGGQMTRPEPTAQSTGSYEPPLSQAGFMDLVCALQANLKLPGSIKILSTAPQAQQAAALQVGAAAKNYVEVVEGRSTGEH